jgi:hypothetical protein
MGSITFRSDREVDAALADLTAEGLDRSEAIRQAILVARRLREQARLRAEAEALVHDEVDLAESRAVLADMEDLRAW